MRRQHVKAFSITLVLILVIFTGSGCALTKDGKLLQELKQIESKEPADFSESHLKQLQGLLASASSDKTKKAIIAAINKRVEYDFAQLMAITGTKDAIKRLDALNSLFSISSVEITRSSLEKAQSALAAEWMKEVEIKAKSILKNLNWNTEITSIILEIDNAWRFANETQKETLSSLHNLLIDGKDKFLLEEAKSVDSLPVKWDTDIVSSLTKLDQMKSMANKTSTIDAIADTKARLMERKQKTLTDEYVAIRKTKIKWDTDLSAIFKKLDILYNLSTDSALNYSIYQLQMDMQKSKEAAIKQHEIDVLLASPRYSYKELMRYPEKYKDKTIRLKGAIVQFLDNQNIRIATGYSSYIGYINDIVYARIDLEGYSSDARLIEGDIIDFAGKINDPMSYLSIFGQTITIPYIDIIWVKVVGGN